MPRLFIAIDLPVAVKQALGDLRTGLPGARWVPDEQLHLTLRFVGETDDAQAAELACGLAALRPHAFPLHLKGVGIFPATGPPRILWVGLKKSAPLWELHRQVEGVVRCLDLPPDRKKFSPHITLARLDRRPAPTLAAYLAAHQRFRQPPFRVTAFRLYTSVLHPHGAAHSCLAEFPLPGPGSVQP
jgi:2'-5' RNA ligase